ncbi:citrate synthase [Lasiodiplodia theobromae]|uniref:Citrate synthase n=1 Tax=Lasiodiplodia theobromae TaxID=45133 RepID=A0A5N5D4S2_9PEZI|nr:Citrate synthase [Lasiodiplodia theobromae]KAB2572699.1 Citrate synthase 2 [Lasiodiplodia theobromae]KAF4538222.1 Citrate synthase [Lasiodiplodia theobromae]KAF9629093.1 citrate synthase [Lasiodiplodia theobromae]
MFILSPERITAWQRVLGMYASSTVMGKWALSAAGAAEMGESSGSLTVTDNRTNRSYNIDIKHNAIKATDFRQITAAGVAADPVDQVESGLRIIDKGYLNTACMESSITLIDGKRGYIQYRDSSIDDLFRNNDYEEVIHLLIWGHLPSAAEKRKFRKSLAEAMVVRQSVVDVIEAFPRDSLTFPMILAGLSAYAAIDKGTQQTHSSGRPAYLGNTAAVDAAIIRTLGALSTTIALVYCHKRGKAFTPADPNGSFIGNVLLMMGFHEAGAQKPNQKIEKCFEKLWILYADHEMTNSTASFLHAASTLTDPISCSISGIVSAYGPLHGGAIDLAYKGFEEVGTPENVPSLIADVKAKKQRLFGYGHRIYKTVDPRAKYIRGMMDEHNELMKQNPLLRIALEVDRVANTDEYFTSRNLKANADLYGCFLYTAMGFETDIIIAMASLSRTAGVMAHWREAMHQTPMLWRPLQVFTGSMAQ